MKKYTQLALIVICILSVLALLICERRYANMKVILEVMDVFETKEAAVKCDRQIELLRRSQLDSGGALTPVVFPVWREVFASQSWSLFVYSAYWDVAEDGANVSRIVAVVERDLPADLDCLLWFDGVHHVRSDSFAITTLSAAASSEGDSTSAVLLECAVRDVSIEPVAVSFSWTTASGRADKSQLVPLESTSPSNATQNFSVCVPPLVSTATPLTLVEFVVYHRHVGVDDFVFYDADSLPDVKRLLAAVPGRTLASVKLLPWNLPRRFSNVSESARIADCLLRSKKRARNALFLQTNQFLSLAAAKDLDQLAGDLKFLSSRGNDTRRAPLVLFHTHYFCDEFSDDIVASSLQIRFVTQRKVKYHRLSEKHRVYLVATGFTKDAVATLRSPNHPVEDNVLVPERSAVVNVYGKCSPLFRVRNTREHYVPDMHMTNFRSLLFSSKLYRYFEKQPYASLLL
uniref:Glycosyltransferase family 92 protein n=1 Tax=Rhipicephalus zambeziensis TaxID=60191 RepID=A0A224YF08_9ACAR